VDELLKAIGNYGMYEINKCAQQSVHWTLGILSHFQAFSSLRVFPAPKQSPRPPQRQ